MRDDGQRAANERLAAFRAYRERLNGGVMAADHLDTKRFFALDTAGYRDEALPRPVKELLGLSTSLLIRCNDGVDYHLDRCVHAGWSDELHDALNVGLVVEASVVIPRLRQAVETIDLQAQRTSGRSDRANLVTWQAAVEPGYGG